MPVPKRKKAERRKKFIPRCLSAKVMKKYPNKQRFAICKKQSEKWNTQVEKK